jgi:hypothetical protein
VVFVADPGGEPSLEEELGMQAVLRSARKLLIDH